MTVWCWNFPSHRIDAADCRSGNPGAALRKLAKFPRTGSAQSFRELARQAVFEVSQSSSEKPSSFVCHTPISSIIYLMRLSWMPYMGHRLRNFLCFGTTSANDNRHSVAYDPYEVPPATATPTRSATSFPFVAICHQTANGVTLRQRSALSRRHADIGTTTAGAYRPSQRS